MRQIIGLMLVCALMSGCGMAGRSPSGGEAKMAEQISFEVVSEAQLPDAVREWADSFARGRKQPGQVSREFDEKTYLVVAAGERTTGGYEVQITEVRREADQVVVHAVVRRPTGMAVQVITYPYVVARIPKQTAPITFVVTER